MSKDDQMRGMELLRDLDDLARYRKIDYYAPYGKQVSFHTMGRSKRERLFMAGNQLGKTYSGAYEAAFHLTGEYPWDWEGREFDHPIVMLAGSQSAELTRDGMQNLLVGPPDDESAWGTGTIPKESIVGWSRKQGVSNALDTVTVKHKSGKNSVIRFKSYDQGRTKWQAATVHVVWFDEEPPSDVYGEGLTRITATDGMVYVTFTPLLGMSEVVRRYLQDQNESRGFVQMTIDDALHIPEEKRDEIISGYLEHEREARSKGVPMLGSGRVFPVAESAITCEPLEISRHWAILVGIDFGGAEHPCGAAWIAHDRDTDTVYVYSEYRAKGDQIGPHAASVRSRGPLIPCAWPHDGNTRDRGSGVPWAKQYRDAGVNMLPKHAEWGGIVGKAGKQSVEAGITEMLDRMVAGRLKIFSTCTMFFEEFRMYHRKDGVLVKEHDDLICAVRYAIMMLRYARTHVEIGNRARRNTGEDKGRARNVDYNVIGGTPHVREKENYRGTPRRG